MIVDVETSALVVIDLQKGIVGMPVEPYSGAEVVSRAAAMAALFRQKDGFVVLVRVATHDGKDMLRPDADVAPPLGERPKDWSQIVPELQASESDYILTKRQWGAFYGTDLDLQLRRRGIKTIVLCGIATGIGVDTTAREAYQRGYRQYFVEDAMSGISTREHEYVTQTIFPRIGHVVRSRDVLAWLN